MEQGFQLWTVSRVEPDENRYLYRACGEGHVIRPVKDCFAGSEIIFRSLLLNASIFPVLPPAVVLNGRVPATCRERPQTATWESTAALAEPAMLACRAPARHPRHV